MRKDQSGWPSIRRNQCSNDLALQVNTRWCRSRHLVPSVPERDGALPLPRVLAAVVMLILSSASGEELFRDARDLTESWAFSFGRDPRRCAGEAVLLLGCPHLGELTSFRLSLHSPLMSV